MVGVTIDVFSIFPITTVTCEKSRVSRMAANLLRFSCIDLKALSPSFDSESRRCSTTSLCVSMRLRILAARRHTSTFFSSRAETTLAPKGRISAPVTLECLLSTDSSRLKANSRMMLLLSALPPFSAPSSSSAAARSFPLSTANESRRRSGFSKEGFSTSPVRMLVSACFIFCTFSRLTLPVAVALGLEKGCTRSLTVSLPAAELRICSRG